MSYAEDAKAAYPTTRRDYPEPTAPPGPITVELARLGEVIEELDGAFGELRGRLVGVLAASELDDVPHPPPTEVKRSPSCEVGCVIEAAVRRLHQIRAHVVDVTRRVEL